MKAKDFRPLCTWKERSPLFGDRFFYVPQHYSHHDKFHFPGWHDSQVFSQNQPICIEYCSGNGSWIAGKAQQDKDVNYVAVEIRYDRVRKIWSKVKNLHLHNLLTVWGEAYTFTHHYVPSASVSKIFINFPDPWPKRKQAKHRLLKPEFICELSRVLKTEGTIMFVTDEENYLEQTCALFLQSPYLIPSFPSPHYVNHVPNYGTSFFDALWRDKGKQIYYLQLLRNDQPVT